MNRIDIALREGWLMQLADLMRPEIEARGEVGIPAYRVTCGFPSKGGELGRKSRTRGQCWASTASDDMHAEVFISPVESDPREIAGILAHELIHAALPGEGHKGGFIRVAKALGYVAPFTSSSNNTDRLWDWVAPLLEKVGPYPHARLNAMHAVGARKKQSARLLKAECGTCGYTVRVTRKWVEQVGPPHCPTDGPMSVDLGDEEAGDDD